MLRIHPVYLLIIDGTVPVSAGGTGAKDVVVGYRGTAAERAAKTAKFGDLWYDTDGSRYVWKGASDGSWRRYSGVIAASAAAWQNVNSTAPQMGARTVSLDIPTTIESTETIVTTLQSGGSGYTFWAGSGVGASSGGVTTVSGRFAQLFSTQTQGLNVAWQIIDK